MVAREPARALKRLDALVTRIHSAAKSAVGDWHLEQTVEVISIVQSHVDDHRKSAQTILHLAERHKQQVAYYERAFVAASATAALELVAAGDRRAADRAMRQAAPVAARLRPQEKLFQEARKVVGSKR